MIDETMVRSRALGRRAELPLDYSRTRDRKSNMKRDLATRGSAQRERLRMRASVQLCVLPFYFISGYNFDYTLSSVSFSIDSLSQSVCLQCAECTRERSEDFALFSVSLAGVL